MADRESHDHEISDPAGLSGRPLVSVLMIAYNQAAYVEQAVQSVLAQETDFPFEIVMGEDCSTDATREIVAQLQAKHPNRLRLLYSDENVGFQRNAKRVLHACRGEFVAILEGDDYWLTRDKLQRQIELMKAHPKIDICISRGQRIYADGRSERYWDRGDKDRIVGLPELLDGGGMIMPTGSILARSEKLRALPSWIFEAPVLDTFLFLGAAAPKGAIYLATDTSAYRMSAEGSWSSAFQRDYDKIKVRHAQRMLDSYGKAIRDFGLDPRWLRRLLSGFRLILAKAEAKDGKLLAALSQLAKIHPAYLAMRVRQRLFESRP